MQGLAIQTPCATAAVRGVERQDNPALAKLIRGVLEAYGAIGGGYASADPEVKAMFETYQLPRSRYFVVEEEGRVAGGGGIAPLRGASPEICELQKLYLFPEARGKGYGKALLVHCLEAAREFGFRQCYIETLPEMKEARRLYERYGFANIECRQGATGHYGCNDFMMKEL